MQAFLKPLAVLCVAVIVLTRLTELKVNRHTLHGHVLETRTLKIFVVTGMLIAIGAIAESFWRANTIHLLPLVLGLLCGIISFRIRRAAIRSLGKFWSLNIEIREQHELIKSGPFLAVRHPTYLSQILELLSLCLIMNAYYPLVLFFLVFIPTMAFRIRKEEHAMVEKFGDDYRQYQRRVPMLFPKSLRHLF